MTTQVATGSRKTTDFREAEYAGPHAWQTQGWARLVRRAMRRRAYMRWVDRYCEFLTVTGQDRFPDVDGPCIVIANHQSHMDSLVLLTALPDAIKNNFYFGAAADRWFVKGKKKLILQPWYRSLVLELGVPVVPVYLSGLRELRPKGQLEVKPGPAQVEILEPLRFAPGTSVADATDRMWAVMNERHLAHNPPAPIRHAA